VDHTAPMALRGVTLATENNNRLLVTVVLALLVLVFIVVSRMYWYELFVASSPALQLNSWSEVNRSRSSRFVSLCSSSFDGRRLGNQLFTWAAMLYVARLTGD